MGMIVSPFSYIALNEAEVTHGKTIQVDLNSLPPPVKARIKDKAKELGMSEKEFEGRMSNQGDYAKENIVTPEMLRGHKPEITDMAISIHGNDAIDGHIMHELEHYDKALDEAILESDDIVKAYNATIDAKFEEALKLAKKSVELEEKYGDFDRTDNNKDVKSFVGSAVHRGYTLPISVLESLIKDTDEMKEMFGVTDADIKKMVCEAVYQPSDNPEEIKKIVNARINKTKVTSWEDMQKNVVSACEKITKKIEETERKQTHNLQELERYADKQAKTVNESSDPNMDKILALFV